MEMERLNANTIRVVLGNEDLEERGITVLDLLGNHKQIESFFYSILEEVDKDHTFATNDAVTFQVMPNKKGLELLISKGAPETSANRVNKPASQNNSDSEHEDVSDFIKRQLQQSDDATSGTTGDYNRLRKPRPTKLKGFSKRPEPDSQEIVLEFSDFEDVISAADALQLKHVQSTLYSYQGHYYLDLLVFLNDLDDITFSDAIAVAFEYGERTHVTPEVLSEYGKTLMHQTALEQIKKYFK